ncbi:MAG TPA: ABC transporter permease [Dongiaceae bacterium]|jgi:ABC-2 type transport system permease protein|nr:ABC transporter permease [Dongiaceae bacterium]
MSSQRTLEQAPVQSLAPRHYSTINWVGLQTLYLKEVRRFMSVATQTILAPMVTTLLFLAVFVLALGHAVDKVAGEPYMAFLAPGLIMMAITQNAFANTSSSILISKIQGNIVDLLMPPLTPLERTIGMAGGGLTRGIMVGVATWVAMVPFVPLSAAHPQFILFHALMASLLMSLVGVLAGVWAEKFDHMAAITNFIVTPAAFLSGTFYSAERLPPFWQKVAHMNPLFYMIDGFRYGFIGHADGSLIAGILVLLGANAALLWLTHRLFATGYHLKA